VAMLAEYISAKPGMGGVDFQEYFFRNMWPGHFWFPGRCTYHSGLLHCLNPQPMLHGWGFGMFWFCCCCCFGRCVGFACSKNRFWMLIEVLCCLYSLGWFPTSNAFANMVAGKKQVCLHHGEEWSSTMSIVTYSNNMQQLQSLQHWLSVYRLHSSWWSRNCLLPWTYVLLVTQMFEVSPHMVRLYVELGSKDRDTNCFSYWIQ
jgi:hypothetical protein